MPTRREICLSRLEVMVLMSGMDLPVRAIREQISSAVDVVVQQSRFKDGKRRVTDIVEVRGMEGDTILMQTLFKFQQQGLDSEGNSIGQFSGAGYPPRFYESLLEGRSQPGHPNLRVRRCSKGRFRQADRAYRWLADDRRKVQAAGRRQRGIGMAETIVAVPILWLVIGVSIELAVLFETKSALNHAALQAARAGMVANADPSALVNGLSRGLLPLYSPEPGLAGAAETLAAEDAARRSGFLAHSYPEPDARGLLGLRRNRQRHTADTERRTASPQHPGGRKQRHQHIQDANLLKLEVTYGAEAKVPGLGALLSQTILLFNRAQLDEFEIALLEAGRLPVLSTATVRMQTPAKINDLMVGSTAEI